MAEILDAQMSMARQWLMTEAFPLWESRGQDSAGSFLEEISLQGVALKEQPRRVMIQGRQLYVFRVARDLGFGGTMGPGRILRSGVEQLISCYSLPSGAFRHSVEADGAPAEDRADLYGQAFVLFGLAHAYASLGDPQLKDRALELLDYLERERRAPAGGFTEVSKNGEALFQSNPHMHLFEAALAWIAADDDPRWKGLAGELAGLAAGKFVQPGGILAEHFNDDWLPIKEAGRFVFEPGHHFEWAWLFEVYRELGGEAPKGLAETLFATGENHGICRERGVAFDEVWSDFEPRKRTSRYWPQCERIKAALRLGKEEAASSATSHLFRYLGTPTGGLCFDHMRESGEFSDSGPKASFLYHVVNALHELLERGPRLR